MVLLVKSKRTLLLPFAACILQAALTCAYPTKEVVQLEDPSKKDGGDGGCLSGTHYVQVDTINNLDKDNTNYSVTFRQVSLECGQPFPSDYDAFSITGTFEPGDVAPDTKGRSQLNLYVCVPYGNYEIDIVIYGEFAAQEGKRIGWEIEDGKTQNHIWDTYNEYTDKIYSPVEPGSYTWPLEGETDPHMANFFIGMDPASPGCDGFDAVPVSAASSAAPEGEMENEGGEGDDSNSAGADSGRGGGGSVSYVEVGAGCYADSPSDRVFPSHAEEADDGSDIDVEFCANLCFDTGYPYCGLENSDECYCGDALPTDIDRRALSSDSCNMPCTGNAHVLCGGRDAITIYELEFSTDGSGSDDGSTDGNTDSGDGDGGDDRDGGDGRDDGRDGGWPEGCFRDKKGDRVLNASYVYKNHQMTHKMCRERCANKGVEFYGVEFDHECFCGNAIPESFMIDDSYCDMPCSGDKSENCGGRDAIRVHYL